MVNQTQQENKIEEMKAQDKELEPEPKRTTSRAAKRIAAVVGVFLLLALVIATLIVACIEFSGKEQVFLALLLCDIVIPVFLWFILRFVS